MAEALGGSYRPKTDPRDAPVLAARSVSVYAGDSPILRNVDLAVEARGVVGIVGPSGSGKSTLLKALNRMIDLERPPLRIAGSVEFHGASIYGPGSDPDILRSRIGVLFQQPVVFPRTIEQNVLFGARRLERLARPELETRLEEALTQAALWDEVKDRLDRRAATLSVGQQQRLCLARTLAVRPEVILMDEPTSALDPAATDAIESLILDLKTTHSVVLVTHDHRQAERVADWIGCVCLRDGAGELKQGATCIDLFEGGIGRLRANEESAR